MIDPDDLQVELAALAGEAVGWQPLEEGAYLHVGDEDARIITVVGIPDAGMAGMNVLLLI